MALLAPYTPVTWHDVTDTVDAADANRWEQALSNITIAVNALISGTAITVRWNKSGATWGAYDQDATRIRIFVSQDDVAAVPPTYYAPQDLWFKAAS